MKTLLTITFSFLFIISMQLTGHAFMDFQASKLLHYQDIGAAGMSVGPWGIPTGPWGREYKSIYTIKK